MSEKPKNLKFKGLTQKHTGDTQVCIHYMVQVPGWACLAYRGPSMEPLPHLKQSSACPLNFQPPARTARISLDSLHTCSKLWFQDMDTVFTSLHSYSSAAVVFPLLIVPSGDFFFPEPCIYLLKKLLLLLLLSGFITLSCRELYNAIPVTKKFGSYTVQPAHLYR